MRGDVDFDHVSFAYEHGSGEVLNEAQENAVSSIEALLGAALPEGYTIEVSSAAQNQTTE